MWKTRVSLYVPRNVQHSYSIPYLEAKFDWMDFTQDNTTAMNNKCTVKQFTCSVSTVFWNEESVAAPLISIKSSAEYRHTHSLTSRQQWRIFTGLILGLHPAIGRRRYKVTPSLIGWAQTKFSLVMIIMSLSCSLKTGNWNGSDDKNSWNYGPVCICLASMARFRLLVSYNHSCHMLHPHGIILCMLPANGRRIYIVTSSHWLGAYTKRSLPPTNTLPDNKKKWRQSYCCCPVRDYSQDASTWIERNELSVHSISVIVISMVIQVWIWISTEWPTTLGIPWGFHENPFNGIAIM